MGRAVRNRIGEQYGHWKVISYDPIKSQEYNKHYWICECDCGCGTQQSIRGDYMSTIKIGGCNQMVDLTRTRKCLKCNQDFAPQKNANQRKYCYNCVPADSYTNGASIRQLIKQWSLEYKGNQCQLCGYNKCSEALDFHHLNPEEKEFNLSDRNIKLDWPEIQKELDKGIILCANCHREIHAKLNQKDLII